MNYLKYVILIIILIGCKTSNVNVQNYDSLDRILARISTYEYGGNRISQTEFDSIINANLNNKNKLVLIEDRIINELSNGCTFEAQKYYCKKLSLIGTENSLEVLRKMLLNQETSDNARYALEKIKSPAVDEILLDALEEVDDNIKIGIVNTLAARKSPGAVDEIAKYVDSKNQKLAIASATALGKIINKNSEDVMSELLAVSDGNIKTALLDSYLLLADHRLSENKIDEAKEIYDYVLKNKYSQPSSLAAFHGLIITSPNKTDSLILSVLKSNNSELINSAIMGLNYNEYSGSAIPEYFNSLDSEAKILILNKIGRLKLNSFIPMVKEAVNDDDINVGETALNCLSQVGTYDELEFLLQQSVSSNSILRTAAQNAIFNISDDKIDQLILDRIKIADKEQKIVLLQAVAARQISSGFKALLENAANDDVHIRLTAYEMLAPISQPGQLDKLIEIFLNIKNKNELTKFESTLADVSLKNQVQNERAAPFLKAIDEVDDFDKKMSLLRILGSTGDKNAFVFIKEQLNSGDENIRKVAIQSLYNWPNLEPIDDLEKIIANSESNTNRILAQRSLINVLKTNQVGKEDKVMDHYKSMADNNLEIGEQRMLLSGLALIRTLESAQLISKYIENPDVKAEAEIALLNVLSELRYFFRDESIDFLHQILKNPSDEDVKLQASLLLDEINR